MRATRLYTLVLVTATVCFAVELPKSQPKPATTASGVFLGRSGRPMAGVRLILCEARPDESKIRLLPNVPIAAADAAGRFTLRGFDPGRWTIIYLLPGVNVAIPKEIDISALEAVDKSPLPLLDKVELPTYKPNESRPWTRQFTLLKGHTFWAMREHMKIWNATVRHDPQGLYLEVRRGAIWLLDFEDKCQIKFEAWTF